MMTDDKKVSMVEWSGNARHWGVEDMLAKALEDVREGRRKCNKALVIYYNDEGDAFDIGYDNCGMRMSEMVFLLSFMEKAILDDMMV